MVRPVAATQFHSDDAGRPLSLSEIRHEQTITDLLARLERSGKWTDIEVDVAYERGQLDVRARYKGGPRCYFECKGNDNAKARQHGRDQMKRAILYGEADFGILWAGRVDGYTARRYRL